MENLEVGDEVYSDYTGKKDIVIEIIEEECVFGKALAYRMKSGYCYWVHNNNVLFDEKTKQLKKTQC